ncbi:hypothetical protein N7457_000425 [Penicillium paradoxum]|uniref:uncharacterized protein n=1 Tax=Penicillium paradoxum TaxID=176176 RepID=UPI00254893E9|nr:uncharacterized protein N7457_000425 [Penicillium paradoxum]KAJ5793826.1 hypothetical protein N7457_000425 [Penicillium paradoxum]
MEKQYTMLEESSFRLQFNQIYGGIFLGLESSEDHSGRNLSCTGCAVWTNTYGAKSDSEFKREGLWINGRPIVENFSAITIADKLDRSRV